jgi:hypothetical protein
METLEQRSLVFDEGTSDKFWSSVGEVPALPSKL